MTAIGDAGELVGGRQRAQQLLDARVAGDVAQDHHPTDRLAPLRHQGVRQDVVGVAVALQLRRLVAQRPEQRQLVAQQIARLRVAQFRQLGVAVGKHHATVDAVALGERAQQAQGGSVLIEHTPVEIENQSGVALLLEDEVAGDGCELGQTLPHHPEVEQGDRHHQHEGTDVDRPREQAGSVDEASEPGDERCDEQQANLGPSVGPHRTPSTQEDRIGQQDRQAGVQLETPEPRPPVEDHHGERAGNVEGRVRVEQRVPRVGRDDDDRSGRHRDGDPTPRPATQPTPPVVVGCDP